MGLSEWVCVWLLSDIESIRQHLLGETEVGSSGNGPIFDRSSSFRSLYPCLTENWGELPLKEDDSEPMRLGTRREKQRRERGKTLLLSDFPPPSVPSPDSEHRNRRHTQELRLNDSERTSICHRWWREKNLRSDPRTRRKKRMPLCFSH